MGILKIVIFFRLHEFGVHLPRNDLECLGSNLFLFLGALKRGIREDIFTTRETEFRFRETHVNPTDILISN